MVDKDRDGYLRLNEMIRMFNPQTDKGSLLTKHIS